MSIRSFISKLFSTRSPSEPAKSVFGPDASRQLSDQAKSDEWDLTLAKEQGKRTG